MKDKMKHIYERNNPEAENIMRRRASVAEINILRKFEDSSRIEGSSLIEDRIIRQLGKLHKLWFRSAR